MADTKTMTLSDWRDRAQRAKSALARVKEEAEKPIQRTMDQLFIGGGAATTGLLRALLGDLKKDNGAAYIPGTEIEADVVIGFVASGIGVFGLAGDEYSDGINRYAAGIMAPAIARETEAMIRKGLASEPKK